MVRGCTVLHILRFAFFDNERLSHLIKLTTRLLLLLVFLTGALALAACDSGEETVPPLPDNFIQYDDQEIGFSFAYPNGWFFNHDPQNPSLFLIASQEELLSSPEAFREGQGSLITLALGKPAAFGGSSDPVFIANGFAELNGLTTNAVVEQPTTGISVNGQPAASATYQTESFGTPMQVRIAVVVNGDRVVTVMTASPVSAETVVGPLIDAAVNSIVISSDE